MVLLYGLPSIPKAAGVCRPVPAEEEPVLLGVWKSDPATI